MSNDNEISITLQIICAVIMVLAIITTACIEYHEFTYGTYRPLWSVWMGE